MISILRDVDSMQQSPQEGPNFNLNQLSEFHNQNLNRMITGSNEGTDSPVNRIVQTML